MVKDGKKINISLAPNPSHLETVGAVVQGIARAKLENSYSNDRSDETIYSTKRINND